MGRMEREAEGRGGEGRGGRGGEGRGGQGRGWTVNIMYRALLSVPLPPTHTHLHSGLAFRH